MSRATTDRRWIDGFDGLRALACLAVFAVHFHDITDVEGRVGPFDLGRTLENGNTGVAVFFMLSAFLLSQPFWADRSLKLGRFVVRRAVRILPAYYLCVTALLVTGKLGSLSEGLSHYLFIHNLSEQTIYGGDTLADNQFWTIAVQVQFYALFPFVLFALRPVRGRPRAAVVVVALLSVAAFGLHVWVMQWAQNSPADTWPTPPRVTSGAGVAYGFVVSHSILAHLPHFLLGVAVGGVYAMTTGRRDANGHQMQSGSSPVCDVLVIGSMLAIAAILTTTLDEAVMVTFAGDTNIDLGRYNWPTVPVLIAVMLVALPGARLTRRVLDFAPLRALGVISYGLYIYHPACQVVTAGRLLPAMGVDDMNESWWLFALVSLALSIVAATVSWWLLERPLLRLTAKVGRK